MAQFAHRGDEALVAAGALASHEQQHAPRELKRSARRKRSRLQRRELAVAGAAAELDVAERGRRRREAAGELERQRVVSSGIHPHVDDERRAIPEGVEEGIEIGDVQLARIPGGDGDVGDAVDDCRHRGASRRRVRAGQVLPPHVRVPVDEIGRHVGPHRGARCGQDDVLIVQPREHRLQDGDQLVLARGGCRPRLEFSLQRVPVDPFVVEIGIDAVERGPELSELTAEIAGRRGRRDWLIVRSTGGCDEQTAKERENRRLRRRRRWFADGVRHV